MTNPPDQTEDWQWLEDAILGEVPDILYGTQGRLERLMQTVQAKFAAQAKQYQAELEKQQQTSLAILSDVKQQAENILQEQLPALEQKHQAELAKLEAGGDGDK